jgi:hypothetical protein
MLQLLEGDMYKLELGYYVVSNKAGKTDTYSKASRQAILR